MLLLTCRVVGLGRAPHIVHTPLQVPAEFLHKFDFMAPTDKKMHQRQIYRESALRCCLRWCSCSWCLC